MKINFKVKPGDIVKLKEPYTDTETRTVWTHGIVVEIISTFNPTVIIGTGETGNIGFQQFKNDPDGVPRNVSLHLFNPETGKIYMAGDDVPTYVDFHINELILVRHSADEGYNTIDLPVMEDE